MSTTAAPKLANASIAELDRLLSALADSEKPEDVILKRAILRVKARRMKASTFIPEPHQVRPDRETNQWRIWLLQGGRGSGKTRTGTEQVMDHLRMHGARANVGVGAPTINDVREVCAEGPSGIITLYGNEFSVYNRTYLTAIHRNGGKVRFLGSEKPNRWNGPQWTFLWADELALWNYDSWIQARFGVRLPPEPWILATTTPKSRKFIREMHTDSRVVLTTATMWDNPHIDENAVLDLIEEYGGTRLGVQELEGKFLPDVEGALWKYEWIDEARVFTMPPDLERIVVAVDPAGSASDQADETAIAVCGRSGKEYYVLQVVGVRDSPANWARMVLQLYDEFDADEIIAERNMGHELVEYTLKSVIPDDRIMPRIKTVHVKRGKVLRADPIAALYQQYRVHHLGNQGWLETESQMCEFPVESEHDDRVDAIVQGLDALGAGKKRMRSF